MLKSLISKCALILVIVLTLSLIGGCAAKETGAGQSPARSFRICFFGIGFFGIGFFGSAASI